MRLTVLQPYQQHFSNFTQVEQIAAAGECAKQNQNRRTARVQVSGKTFYIKVHRGVGWGEIVKNFCYGRLPIISAVSEWKAIAACSRANILTPTAVGVGERGCNPARKHSFLITEDIGVNTSLDEVIKQWKTQPVTLKEKRKLIARVAEIVRKLHQAGLNHRDLYLCHFLLKESDQQLFLIDLHRVQRRKVVPRRWLVKDLGALFFSSFELDFSTHDITYFMTCYFQTTLKQVVRSQQKLLAQIEQRAEALYRKQCNKQLKANPPSLDSVNNTPTLQQILANPEAIIAEHQVAQKKQDKTTSVYQVQFDSQTWIIKRYNYPSLLSVLTSPLKMTRAKRNTTYSQCLNTLGINALCVRGSVKKTVGPFCYKAYLVMDFAGPVSLFHYCLDEATPFDKKAQRISQARRLLQQLWRAGFVHGDTKFNNFCIDGQSIVLLDLDATQKPRFTWRLPTLQRRDARRFQKDVDALL